MAMGSSFSSSPGRLHSSIYTLDLSLAKDSDVLTPSAVISHVEGSGMSEKKIAYLIDITTALYCSVIRPMNDELRRLILGESGRNHHYNKQKS
jgi:hypothetical protein